MACDFLLLFESDDVNPASLMAQYPGGVVQETEAMLSLAVPECVRTKAMDSTVFCFNVATSYEFTWAFRYGYKSAALVAVSSRFWPSLFFDFWRAVADCFPPERSEDSDPMCRFGFVKSLLATWAMRNDVVHVTYPLESFSMKAQDCANWMANFSIGPLYPHGARIWRELLANQSILIIATTPEIACAAVIAALSLLKPYRYSDPFLLHTTRKDIRSPRISEGYYKLVGTTDQDFDPAPFDMVIAIRGNKFEDDPELKYQCQRKTERYFAILMSLMNYELLKNPYFDILEYPIDIEKVQNTKDADRDLLVKMQRGAIFRDWRKLVIVRDQVRTAFVSTPPEQAMEYVTPENCQKALDCLTKIEEAFPGDFHLMAVLKKHRTMLKKKMR
jgi:hypothetical protein